MCAPKIAFILSYSPQSIFRFFQFVHQLMDCYRYVQVVLEQVPYYQLFLALKVWRWRV